MFTNASNQRDDEAASMDRRTAAARDDDASSGWRPAADTPPRIERRPDRMTAGSVTAERPSRDQLLELLHATTYLLMRQNHADARQALSPLGLQPPLAFVLLMISQESIRHPKGLADLLCVPPSMMSVMLNDLEKRGLLERNTDPADRRRVLLSITEPGQGMIEKILDAWTTVTRNRLAPLDEEDLQNLVRLQRMLLESPL